MKLISIIANNKGEKTPLFSVHFDEEELHELAKIEKNWQDSEYMIDFFATHEEELKQSFQLRKFHTDDITEAAFYTLDTAEEWFYTLYDVLDSDENIELSSLFKALDDNEYSLYIHQQLKAKSSIIRIYAIRIGERPEEGFIITGGAIKLWEKMDDHPSTEEEKRKLNEVKAYLKEQEIEYIEDTEDTEDE